MNKKIKYSPCIWCIIILTLFALTFGSCNNPYKTLYYKVKSAYNNPDSNVKLIDLKLVFPNNWDEIYIFESSMNREDIFEITGTDCNCKTVHDAENLFLFLEKGRIVSSSYVAPFNNIIFSGQYMGTGFFRISDTASVFIISKTKYGNFLLKPSK